MFFNERSDEARAYAQVSQRHEAPLSHELIAGAASYEAAKAYAHHRQNKGDPMNHEKAFEVLAGFSGAWIDKYAESRGMDAVSKAKLKREAERRTQQGYRQTYGQI